MFITVSLIAMW